jgi:hypothetical protein
MRLIKQLWAGEIPLGLAFWRYTVVYGLLLNLVTHALFFALLVKDADTIPVVLAFVLPIPYNILMIVAVWRSADRYPGPKSSAEAARAAAVLWMVALSAA